MFTIVSCFFFCCGGNVSELCYAGYISSPHSHSTSCGRSFRFGICLALCSGCILMFFFFFFFLLWGYRKVHENIPPALSPSVSSVCLCSSVGACVVSFPRWSRPGLVPLVVIDPVDLANPSGWWGVEVFLFFRRGVSDSWEVLIFLCGSFGVDRFGYYSDHVCLSCDHFGLGFWMRTI